MAALPYTGQTDNVQLMLGKCAALAKAKTKDGLTPLMWAANKGHVKVCPTRKWANQFQD